MRLANFTCNTYFLVVGILPFLTGYKMGASQPKKASEGNSFALMAKCLAQQDAMQTKQIENAIAVLKTGALPTPTETVTVINSAVTKRPKILSYHCFWKEMKIREGFKSIMDVAHTSYVDICRHNAALVGLSENYSVFEDQVSHMISNPLQKDVMAFCAAAFGCIDTVRRLKKCRPDMANVIEEAIADNLSGHVFDFILSLRKNLSHGSVVIPAWTLTENQEGMSGNMVFEVEGLLSFGKWSSGAKVYLNEVEKGKIDIAKAIGDYNSGLIKFAQCINDILARSVTDAERDYYNIEDSHKRLGSGQWMKVLASQIGKGKNPYNFLHRYFTPEEVREILRKPKHSQEQVDYIISLRSVETECDSDLRSKLYELFGVVTR